jgi:hypothetical protein
MLRESAGGILTKKIARFAVEREGDPLFQLRYEGDHKYARYEQK